MIGKSLGASVGIGRSNRVADVLTVQYLLNCVPSSEGGPRKELLMDGIVGPLTHAAIERFQMAHFGFANGRVEKGKGHDATFRSLRQYDPFPDAPPISPPLPDVTEEERRGTIHQNGSSKKNTGEASTPGIPGIPSQLDSARWRSEMKAQEKSTANGKKSKSRRDSKLHMHENGKGNGALHGPLKIAPQVARRLTIPSPAKRKQTKFVREVVIPGGLEAKPRLRSRYCYFKLKLADSPIHRWGVFASEPIPARRRVIEYSGQKIDAYEVWRRSFRHLLYLFWLNDHWALDGAIGGSGAEFINHSCDPNVEARSIGGHIYFTSLRRIAPGEELTLDYHLEDEGLTIPCTCGSPRCRGIVSG